jgi:hypothetical protein
VRRALQPAPQQRAATDQRHDSRKNTGHVHVVLLLIARTLSDTTARANFAPGVARYADRNIVPFGRLFYSSASTSAKHSCTFL